MLTHPTLDQLKALKFDGMAEAFTELETQDGTATLSHAEWLGLLIDRETASRETKRFESRMRSAKLRHAGASPRRRRLPIATQPRQGAVPAVANREVDQGPAQPDDHRPLRGRQNMVGLCAGTIRLPHRNNRDL